MNRYAAVSLYLDRQTGEYVAVVPDENGTPIEVDRLPASTTAGGPGTLADEVRGIRDRAAAAAAAVSNVDAKDIGQAVAGP